MAFHRSLHNFVKKHGHITLCHPAIVAMLDDDGLSAVTLTAPTRMS